MPRGSQLVWYAVINAVRACMQSRGLPEALQIGLDQFRLADLRARDLPDMRLDMLLEEAEDLGRGISDEIAAKLARACRPGVGTALADCATRGHSRRGPDVAGEAEGVQDRAGAVAGRLYFERSAAALKRRGARVLGYNGHQPFTDETVAEVHRLAPAARAWFSAAAADAAEPDKIMQDFGLERLRVRDQPLPARVLLLADVPGGTARMCCACTARPGLAPSGSPGVPEHSAPSML